MQMRGVPIELIYSDDSDNINSLDSGLKIDESSEIHADKSTFIVFNYVF